EMTLHAEIPRVAFLGLMHLGIAGLVGILSRARRTDDRRIDNRAGSDFQPLRRQVPLHLVEQTPAQIVRLGQVAKAAHCRLIRHWLAATLDADEPPHRLRIEAPLRLPGPTD